MAASSGAGEHGDGSRLGKGESKEGSPVRSVASSGRVEEDQRGEVMRRDGGGRSRGTSPIR